MTGGGASWGAGRGLAAAALIAGGAARAEEAAPGWTEVAALFAVRCTMCHEGEDAALGLRLDSLEGALAGSRDGPVLVPGDAGASELVRRVRGESQPRMPFLGPRLPEEEIALLERWVGEGLGEGLGAGGAEPAPEGDGSAPGP